MVDKTAIALQFVESMKFHTDEDLTASVLRNDRFIDIVMCSGKEYTVSVWEQLLKNQREDPRLNMDHAQHTIYDRWRHILTGKS